MIFGHDPYKGQFLPLHLSFQVSSQMSDLTKKNEDLLQQHSDMKLKVENSSLASSRANIDRDQSLKQQQSISDIQFNQMEKTIDASKKEIEGKFCKPREQMVYLSGRVLRVSLDRWYICLTQYCWSL